MSFTRSSGVLLHPTSLPGPDGIGDLGPEAYRWVDFLDETGCSIWQILPLGPTGYGDSPYQCFSAFAGNPYLVNSALLLEDGLLTGDDLADRPAFAPYAVDYGPVIQWKITLLDRAYARFKRSTSQKRKAAFDEFRQANADWLTDFALFMAIKEANGGVSWDNWPAGLRNRDPQALDAFREKYADAIQRHEFRQFLFFRQWMAVKKYANDRQIQIVGDVPIFVAYDSADAWANPGLFYLDSDGKPTVVAGVPPDYFSETGQLWGNPLYRWDVHRETGYAWWIARVKSALSLVDIIRLDHFRGFAAYWEVPFGETTAVNGHWVTGPGTGLFYAIRDALGSLPIIAEDLGEITPDVIAMRNELGLPGMKILQFAFAADPEDLFLPHNYVRNCVAYTGTHDNDTTRGWYTSAPEKERDMARRYLARSGDDISWDFIRAVWSSIADVAVAPLQDFLSLGNEARMNYPGRASGNWTWRFDAFVLDEMLKVRMRESNFLYSRLPEHKKPPKVVKKWT